MDLPSLRHFINGHIYAVHSDPVVVSIGGAESQAIYTDAGWYAVDGTRLIASIDSWRHGSQTVQSAEKSQQGAGRVQGRPSAQRQARKGQRAHREKP